MHTDALKPGARVLLMDDLLATGGTAAAAIALMQRLGGKIVEVEFPDRTKIPKRSGTPAWHPGQVAHPILIRTTQATVAAGSGRPGRGAQEFVRPP